MDVAKPRSQSKIVAKGVLPASLTVFAIVLIVAVICLIIDRVNNEKWRTRPHKQVSDLRLKTGDILLFSGRSFSPLPTMAFLIKLVTNSDISHVGIVWEDPLSGKLWVWHTATVPRSCKSVYPKDGECRLYAHLISLEEATQRRYGRVYLRPCSHELNAQHMSEFIRKHLGREYSLDIALHWYGRHMGLAPLNFLASEEGQSGACEPVIVNAAKWSCGELLVHCLVHMGVMPATELAAAHSYLPNDFSSSNYLRLINGISYGREICLDVD